MRATHRASTSQMGRWWCMCVMLTFFLLYLWLCPRSASALEMWVTDMDGNVISSGSTVDINTLQKGYVLHCQYEDGESAVTGGTTVLNETTGSLVASYIGQKVDADEGWYTSIYFSETLQPGTNYGIEIAASHEISNTEHVWSNTTTISLTTSGGGSSTNTGEVPTTTNTSNPDSGLDDAGTGTDAANQTAETGSDVTSSNTSSTSDTASAEQVSVSTDGNSQMETMASRSSVASTGGSALVADDSSTGGSTVSGNGVDDTTQIAGAGVTGRGSTYLALGSLGTVYSVEDVANDVTQASDDETTEEDQDATSALSIIGLPYLWVALWVLLCAMLPVGLLSRYLGYRIGLARHSRLG